MDKERYCEIRCESLEDIRDTCRRHIKNTQPMLLGCIDAEDLTETDAFYLDMQERMCMICLRMLLQCSTRRKND